MKYLLTLLTLAVIVLGPHYVGVLVIPYLPQSEQLPAWFVGFLTILVGTMLAGIVGVLTWGIFEFWGEVFSENHPRRY